MAQHPPVRLGADVASLNTGIFATQAITAALFHRLRTGEGHRVTVSQFGSLLHMRGIMWTAMTASTLEFLTPRSVAERQ